MKAQLNAAGARDYRLLMVTRRTVVNLKVRTGLSALLEGIRLWLR